MLFSKVNIELLILHRVWQINIWYTLDSDGCSVHVSPDNWVRDGHINVD